MKPYPTYKDSGIEWIGNIPKHWNVRKLKLLGIFTSSAIDKKTIEGETLVKMINYTDIYGNTSCVLNSNREYMIVSCPEEKKRVHNIKKGDVVFTPSSETTEEIGLSAVVNEDLPNTVYSYHVIRLRFSERVNHGYKKYLCNNNFVLNQFSKCAKGTTRQILGRNDFKNIQVLIPLESEQEKIATYLDCKTTQIDDLIAKKERMIELLKEERTAIINHAVTKGIDPNVEMKDTGIEWLGKIPKNWKSVPLTKYLESIADYRGKTPTKNEIDGVFLITTRNIKSGKIDYSLSQEFVDPNEYEIIMSRGLPKIGDVLLTMEAPLGEVANIDNEKVALAQRIIKLRGKKNIVNNYFLKYWMMSSTFQSHLQSLATGSTALGIKSSKLNQLKIIFPVYGDQLKIDSFLDYKTAQIGAQIENITKTIDCLQEYRTALISEVVTGKIDVRE